MVKKLIIGLIKLYQLIISPLIHWLSFSFFGGRPGCRFYPTCSQYAIESFSNFNFLKASALVLDRLKRCHPYL